MVDKYVEKFGQFSAYILGYMRDVTFPMHHSIRPLKQGIKTIGRAFTVRGPDLYLDALESMPEGAVYVHAEINQEAGVFSGALGEIYAKPRGVDGVVIDGGVYDGESTSRSEIPIYARFVSPRPAINRKHGILQVPIVCGGVTVCPGDIIRGDDDGLVVIPQSNEEEMFEKIDGFIAGIRFFRKIAMQPGIVVTEHEALGEMLDHKYASPYNYWRFYEPWANKWRKKYGGG